MARPRRRGKDDGEKPFWISYADLMTAMMVLFLSAMAVTIAAVTRVVEGPAEARAREIKAVCEELERELGDVPDIRINCADHRISFGDVGRFAVNSYRLPVEADAALARLVPAVLDAADGELGRRWLKQVVVEGYTDTVGGYLYNLHLSLQRSEWVLCLLMDPAKNAQLELTPAQLERVRRLFLAGGVSFNNQRQTADESRRVELRIQFYGLGEEHASPHVDADTQAPEGDRCQL
ncbi:flagellar motor protein MotB [Coralloluteibacterium stylophorae]|nr:flagellar motor protein MotB [Coralloluteibacterium stylophorae]